MRPIDWKELYKVASLFFADYVDKLCFFCGFWTKQSVNWTSSILTGNKCLSGPWKVSIKGPKKSIASIIIISSRMWGDTHDSFELEPPNSEKILKHFRTTLFLKCQSRLTFFETLFALLAKSPSHVSWN